MGWQKQIRLPSFNKGLHSITEIIRGEIIDLDRSGMLFINILHTSAALTINENADPDVMHDMRLYYERMVPENLVGIRHTMEGPDDMPAHVMSSITGNSVNVPIANGKLILGTWQGIFLCEFRNSYQARNIVLTVL